MSFRKGNVPNQGAEASLDPNLLAELVKRGIAEKHARKLLATLAEGNKSSISMSMEIIWFRKMPAVSVIRLAFMSP